MGLCAGREDSEGCWAGLDDRMGFLCGGDLESEQVGEDEEMGGREGGSIGDRCDAVESFMLHEIGVRVMRICFDSI